MKGRARNVRTFVKGVKPDADDGWPASCISTEFFDESSGLDSLGWRPRIVVRPSTIRLRFRSGEDQLSARRYCRKQNGNERRERDEVARAG